MNQALAQADHHNNRSWQTGPDPIVLADVLSEKNSVTVWQRPINSDIQAYFLAVFDELGMGFRSVLNMQTMRDSLQDLLPQAPGKEQTVEDIYLLSDMLTYLFDCEEVGFRLICLNKAMCPRFHVDNIPIRLVTTYCGPGTEWLPNEFAQHGNLGHAAEGLSDQETGLYSDEAHVQQMQSFDVGLLKGTTWDEQHFPAIHRSCALQGEQRRVLLTLDPI